MVIGSDPGEPVLPICTTSWLFEFVQTKLLGATKTEGSPLSCFNADGKQTNF